MCHVFICIADCTHPTRVEAQTVNTRLIHKNLHFKIYSALERKGTFAVLRRRLQQQQQCQQSNALLLTLQFAVLLFDCEATALGSAVQCSTDT